MITAISLKNIVLAGSVLWGMAGGSFAYADSLMQGDATGSSQEAVFSRAKWIGPAADRPPHPEIQTEVTCIADNKDDVD